MILLDTSFVIELLKRPERVSRWLEKVDSVGGALTAITHLELFRKRSRMSPRERSTLERLFSVYGALPFNLRASEEACELLIRMERAGEAINLLDLMIGGIMRANGISQILTIDVDFKKLEKYADIEAIIFR